MMSNDALIRDLTQGLMPVRRRSMLRESGWLALLCALELALILMLGLMRPDMSQMIGSAYMLWKLGSLALLAGISCTVAMRSFSPPGEMRKGFRLALTLAALMMAAGLAIGPAAGTHATLLERISPLHGMVCALTITILSLPIMAMLGMLMRRGAPVRPEGSALASGLAAGSCGALIFALCCPVNDPLYVVVWYAAACCAVMAAARWLLPRNFRL